MMPVRLMVNLRSQLTQLPLEGIGLVHGDFELDNLKWSHGIPTAFDFDEAAVSWFAADVAIAVRDIADRPELLAAFLSGYRSVRALTDGPLYLVSQFGSFTSPRLCSRSWSAWIRSQC